MGLFGGFKAKFTKDSKTKDKSNNNVVVLKYYAYPEFDTTYRPESLPNNIQKNDNVHDNQKYKVRHIVNSAVFDDSKNIRNQIKKSSSLNNLTTEPKTTQESTGISTDTGKLSISHNDFSQRTPNQVFGGKNNVANAHVRAQKQEYKKYNDSTHSVVEIPKGDTPKENFQATLASSSSLEQNITISKQSPPINISYDNDKSENEEQSTLIFMTQQQPDIGNATEIYGTHPADRNHKENDEFKVNVVQHDRDRINSFSEDEISYIEDEPTKFGAFGYSSQATSIFFEGDLQPTINRPRRILFENNDKDEDVDQERTENEVDC